MPVGDAVDDKVEGVAEHGHQVADGAVGGEEVRAQPKVAEDVLKEGGVREGNRDVPGDEEDNSTHQHGRQADLGSLPLQGLKARESSPYSYSYKSSCSYTNY